MPTIIYEARTVTSIDNDGTIISLPPVWTNRATHCNMTKYRFQHLFEHVDPALVHVTIDSEGVVHIDHDPYCADGMLVETYERYEYLI